MVVVGRRSAPAVGESPVPVMPPRSGAVPAPRAAGTVAGMDEPITDAELTALAMAADPDAPLDDDAVPFGGTSESPLLPAWYMPAPQAKGRGPRRVFAVTAIVVALLVVNGVGLCVTYGFPEIAW